MCTVRKIIYGFIYDGRKGYQLAANVRRDLVGYGGIWLKDIRLMDGDDDNY